MDSYRKRPVLAGASFAAGVALLMACNAEDTTQRDLLGKAVEECAPDSLDIRLEDGGSTLIIDQQGEQDGYGASLEQVACVIWLLEPPSSVTSHMDSTRALDGIQEASWDGFNARWSYHPDNGLDVVITLD